MDTPYKRHIGNPSASCVITSGGVSIAATMKMMTTAIRQCFTRHLDEMTPSFVINQLNIGISKTIPKATIRRTTKS